MIISLMIIIQQGISFLSAASSADKNDDTPKTYSPSGEQTSPERDASVCWFTQQDMGVYILVSLHLTSQHTRAGDLV